MRTIVLLLMVGLLTVPALGGGVNVDVASELGTHYTGSWTHQVSNPDPSWGFMQVVSSVYQDGDGNLAFVYDLTSSTDLVYSWTLYGDFSSAQSEVVLHTSGGSLGFPSITFDGNLSVSFGFLDNGEHFIFSFLVPSSAGLTADLYHGDAYGFTGTTEGYAYAPGQTVPEPGTLFLLAAGLIAGAVFRKRFT